MQRIQEVVVDPAVDHVHPFRKLGPTATLSKNNFISNLKVSFEDLLDDYGHGTNTVDILLDTIFLLFGAILLAVLGRFFAPRAWADLFHRYQSGDDYDL